MLQAPRIEILRHKAWLHHNRFAVQPVLQIQARIEDCAAGISGRLPDSVVSTLEQFACAVKHGQEHKSTAYDQLRALLKSDTIQFDRLAAQFSLCLLRQADPRLESCGALPAHPDHLHFFFSCREVNAGLVVARTALVSVALLDRAQRMGRLDGLAQRLESALPPLMHQINEAALNQTTRALVEAAEQRDIPWFQMSGGRRYVQLGQGRNMHRLLEAMSDQEYWMAGRLAANKIFCSSLLKQAGFPVPRFSHASTREEAAQAAKMIGYPVVVKPTLGGKGRGITIGVESDEEAHVAFERVLPYGRTAIVEAFVPGKDHRLLVVDGQLVAAAQRVPAQVTGDGKRSIEDLVTLANEDPRRGRGFSLLQNIIEIDQVSLDYLQAQGLTPSSVPADGEIVPLKRTANIHTGGSALEMTDTIHPDNRALAERAARTIGLRVAGVDFLTEDIARSYKEIGGAICEVNGQVGLRPHWIANPNRDVVGPILETIYPRDKAGRIPIAVVTGSIAETTTCNMLAAIARATGKTPGLATSSDVIIGDISFDLGEGSGADAVLGDPSVDMAVLEIQGEEILQRGLAFDWCDVAALTRTEEVAQDAQSTDAPKTLSRARERIMRTARKAVILDAGDQACLSMIERLSTERTILVDGRGANSRPEHESVTRASIDGKDSIVLVRNGEQVPILAVRDLFVLEAGNAEAQLRPALFAVALAIGLDMPKDAIARGLGAGRTD